MVCLNIGAYNIQVPMFLPYRKVRLSENFPHKKARTEEGMTNRRLCI